MTRRFTMEKKMVAQVRFYQTMYVIRDAKGERIYTGDDEKFAKKMLRLLNGYDFREKRAEERGKKKRKRKGIDR